MSDTMPISTEKLIEHYTYYLDGKVQLSPENARELEMQLSCSSFEGISAGRLLHIFRRCAKSPNPFAR